MSLLERILSEPELTAAPPVLVDVGAAGGMHRAWRTLAPHAIGIGFEPDTREAPEPGPAQRQFGRWIFCAGLAVPVAGGHTWGYWKDSRLVPGTGCWPAH